MDRKGLDDGKKVQLVLSQSDSVLVTLPLISVFFFFRVRLGYCSVSVSIRPTPSAGVTS